MSFILIDPSLNRERERAVTTFDGLEKECEQPFRAEIRQQQQSN